MFMQVPAGLDWWRSEPGGAEWLAALPQLVDQMQQAWSLQLVQPLEPARVAYVAQVHLEDGSPAVLKLNKPEAESAEEGDALEHWGGRGAVRLLAQDKDRHALLLECCAPGSPLRGLSEPEALEVAAGILRRFRGPAPAAGPYRQLADVASVWRWRSRIAGRARWPVVAEPPSSVHRPA